MLNTNTCVSPGGRNRCFILKIPLTLDMFLKILIVIYFENLILTLKNERSGLGVMTSAFHQKQQVVGLSLGINLSK